MRNPFTPLQPPVKRPTEAERVRLVRHIFSTVTGSYDFLNRLLSLRRDVAWRRKTVLHMRFQRTRRLLDVATGTCDLAVEAALHDPSIRVVGADLVRDMMEAGEAKIRRRGLSHRIRLLEADALSLPFAGERFDAASMAFGIRNIPDRVSALREMARVVVPGGRVLILELALPRYRVFQRLYGLYLNGMLPRLAGLFSPNPEAYRYLADTVMTFPAPEAFAALMQEAGLERVEIHPLTFGVTYLHVGHKPFVKDGGSI
jgi:demethylmenaquinone methyltransferase/2-methoxy-6-polyprenyl-1,4-benzoquinol methylase